MYFLQITLQGAGGASAFTCIFLYNSLPYNKYFCFENSSKGLNLGTHAAATTGYAQGKKGEREDFSNEIHLIALPIGGESRSVHCNHLRRVWRHFRTAFSALNFERDFPRSCFAVRAAFSPCLSSRNPWNVWTVDVSSVFLRLLLFCFSCFFIGEREFPLVALTQYSLFHFEKKIFFSSKTK